MEGKIKQTHLDRAAYIYVRQSTLGQVRKNTISTLQQYDLVKRIVALGWTSEKIIVIDWDQARSASTTDGRDGFKKILAEIAVGNVGAVVSIKGDRLSRDSFSWHKLLKLCELSDTLVIDEACVYDPCKYEDRLLLDVTGALSEAEERIITRRMLSAKRRKAETGELRFPLPVGYICDPTGKTIFDPNEEIQGAIRSLFDVFDRRSSIRMAVKYFNEEKLLFPSRLYGQVSGGTVQWVRLRYTRAAAILHNPAYAGAYVYGRTASLKKVNPDDTSEVRTMCIYVAQDKWRVKLLNNHQGYITWEKFLINQRRIEENKNVRSKDYPGAIRAGAALLQGIALCGFCGWKMQVAYPKGRKHPQYFCNSQRIEYAAPKGCQSFAGDLIDEAVSHNLLAVIKPAQLELTIAAIEKIAVEVKQTQHQRNLRLERANYEAALAHRRFLAVDPENRLVARNLEHEWNEKLVEVERLSDESKYSSSQLLTPLGQTELRSVLNLSKEFPKVWRAETTTQIERKQLLRCLIKDVTLKRIDRTVFIGIRWRTDICTTQEVRLPTTSDHHRTPPSVISLIRELAPYHSHQEIANYLNEKGVMPKRNHQFTKQIISALCFKNRILGVGKEA